MSNAKQETIADIVREMRIGDLCANDTTTSMVYINDFLAGYADRIEAAMRHQFREVTKMIPHEEVAVSKMETTNQAREKSSAVGNAAAMREALEKSDAALSLIAKSAWFFDANFRETREVMEAVEAIKVALSAPPRNCDVGTADEQAERFAEYCDSEACKRNRCKSRAKALCIERCAIAWAQMPYESEVK